jgi:hypothetical protein
MEVNQESVRAHQTLLMEPAKYNLKFRAIQDCFEKSDTVTAKHILAKQYMEKEAKMLTKIMCYIVMDNVFGQCNGKDSNGNLGYYLTFKEK